jgi:uncharacterized SAM-binding protein YcdF (DUF218 family)
MLQKNEFESQCKRRPDKLEVMFIAAKLLAFLTQPLAWVGLLGLCALLVARKRPAWASRLGLAALALLFGLGWEPLPDALTRALESRYPANPALADPAAYAGVIVLGGALEPAYLWTVPGQSALNESAERMTDVLPLARQHPQWQVLFTGGEGEWLASGPSEAERARRFFATQGLDADRLLLEGNSRTTFENALLSRQVAGPLAARPWLLLTSAMHMPRAMATFQKLGWKVTAYPVDFRTGEQTPWTQYTMDIGAKKWRQALHEWLGLLAYQLSGQG